MIMLRIGATGAMSDIIEMIGEGLYPSRLATRQHLGTKTVLSVTLLGHGKHRQHQLGKGSRTMMGSQKDWERDSC